MNEASECPDMVIRYKNITETKEMVVDKCVGYCVGVCMFERGRARARACACVCACREWGLEVGYMNPISSAPYHCHRASHM